MVALPGRARQGSLVLVGSPSRRFSVGFLSEAGTFTDHLDAGLAVLLSLKLFAAPQPDGQKRRVNHPPHMDRQ